MLAASRRRLQLVHSHATAAAAAHSFSLAPGLHGALLLTSLHSASGIDFQAVCFLKSASSPATFFMYSASAAVLCRLQLGSVSAW